MSAEIHNINDHRVPCTDTHSGLHLIESASGQLVDIRNPAHNSIRLSDIAYHLSRINRFTGATRGPGINVAAHSLWVAHYLGNAGYTPATQLHGLIHDAAEAYLGDIAKPLKTIPELRAAYAPLERQMIAAIRIALLIPPPTARQQAAVDLADTLAASAEARVAMPSRGASSRYAPLDTIARRMPVRLWHPMHIWPSYAARCYCRLFEDLAGRRLVQPTPESPAP